MNCTIKFLRKSLLSTGTILLMLLPAACRPESPPLPALTPLPICAPDELARIAEAAPTDEVIDDLTPTIQWTYPDSTCRPEGYKITLFTRWWYTFEVVLSDSTVGLEFTVPDDHPLQPATHYDYVVRAVSEGVEGPATFNQFSFDTGPQCSGTGELLPPVLLDPPDMYHLTSPYVVLEWRDPSPCTPASRFYNIQFSESPTFDTIIYENYSGIRNMAFIGWSDADVLPYEMCAIYYWRVRAGGYETSDYGPWSEPRSMYTDIDRSCLEPPIPGITPHPGPIGGATPTFTPTSSVPTARLLQNAYCRRGPGTDYDVLTDITRGSTVALIGRTPDNSWWQVRTPDGQAQCWLAGQNVETSGDTSNVPIVETGAQACWVKGPNDNEPRCTYPCPQGAQPGGACTP
jgi:hypothetical protein